MAWWQKFGKWIGTAVSVASNGAIAMDWVLPNARFLTDTMASLEISRAAPAAYTFFIVFFSVMLMAVWWEPIYNSRPSLQFSKLREEILRARDLANVSDPQLGDDLFPATWALALKLKKFRIDFPYLNLTNVRTRMLMVRFLTELVACAEMKDLASARKLRAPFEVGENQN